MLAAAFQTRCELQHCRFVESRRRLDRNEFWFAFSQGPGFIDDERVDLAQHFDRFGVSEQHAGVRALSGRNHDRHRRREAERARTGNNQHRDRVDNRVSHARLRTDCGPHKKRDDRNEDHNGNEVTGNYVREFLNRRATPLRFRHHLHDLRQQRFRPNAFRLHHE